MEYIEHDGQEFALACLDRTALVGSVRPCLEDSISIIAQAKWEPCDFSALLPDPGLQGNHGACVAFQAGNAVEAARAIAGLQNTRLSKWALYALICGGRDQGANIGDSLTALHTKGTCTLATCPDFTLTPPSGAAWEAESARYRVDESFDCPDRASIATAVQCRFPAPFGLQVYSNFTSLEETQGRLCVPKPAGRLRGGHCVLACGLDYFAGQWWLLFATKSWGSTFGKNGCAYYPLNNVSDSYADAYCVRSVLYSEN
jgi:hypothetical protein